jgi:enoyl-CoA hydratase/carnithine racemase
MIGSGASNVAVTGGAGLRLILRPGLSAAACLTDRSASGQACYKEERSNGDPIRTRWRGGKYCAGDPPFNRLDLHFAEALRIAVHQASESDIRVLVVRSEGPHFSFGGEVREWPGKDVNWFRTFVAEVNASYRAIEMLKIPTLAVVRGIAFGGGFELALACDFLVAAENATFRCVEVTTAMLPLAGALQRIAERAGRARASRFAMLGEPISGTEAGRAGNCNACSARKPTFEGSGGLDASTRNRANKVVCRDAHPP